jgi:hypothetical protein
MLLVKVEQRRLRPGGNRMEAQYAKSYGGSNLWLTLLLYFNYRHDQTYRVKAWLWPHL